MKKTILLILLAYTGQLTLAQSPNATLKSHFKAIAKNQSSFLTKDQMTSLYTAKEVITTLEKYLKEEKKAVQGEAVRLLARVGSNHENTESRQKAVFLLLTKVPGASSILAEKIAKGLQKFKTEDFSEVAIEQLLTVIYDKPPHLGKFIELAGFLQLNEPLEEIKVQFKDDKNLRKSVGMALVRSGNEQKMESLMTTLKEQKINDDFIYGAVPLLVYARQKGTTDFLFDIIMSDEKNCTPNGPDVGGKILCAYRVMEELAPYVEDFPVQVGASGDLDTDDYKKTLKDVRTWIGAHRGDYHLKTEVY